ncbi:MAG: DUF4382 domain-containing protein [Cyclobacteriaceae bacterium]|nr:DUF4382 domain-containing protein [Cyclobacteriaceae bacterium]
MKTAITFLTLLLFFTIGCTDSEVSERIQIRLTDAPGDFDAVNIDIAGIEYHLSTGNQPSGWMTMENVNTGVYNLLDFANGIDTVLADAELSTGKISQIRFILGNNNSVVIDGTEHAMSTPSAQTSGLKLNLHADILEGITYKVLLDFDAARSVVQRGGKFSLKPTIRVVSEAQNGAITGTVNPVEASPAIFAIQNEDTVTTYADSTGYFLIGNLDAGTYSILFDADSLFNDQEVNNVLVNNGEITDLGVIEF